MWKVNEMPSPMVAFQLRGGLGEYIEADSHMRTIDQDLTRKTGLQRPTYTAPSRLGTR